MHPLFERAHGLSREVIGAAIEVHRLKGSGLLESIYEKCLVRELGLRGLTAVNQQVIKIEYKGLVFDELLRFDVLVERSESIFCISSVTFCLKRFGPDISRPSRLRPGLGYAVFCR